MVSTDVSPKVDVEKRELVLQIRGTARDGQIVRLRSEKCTIGSGPRCTLRLRAPGVHPVHCLILRGPTTTMIRRWAPDTRLNGRAFADAELVPGDRLAIGPIEFEVLQSTCPPIPRPVPSSPPLDRRPRPAPDNRPEPDLLVRRLTLANRQGRRRARRLIHQLRSARQRIARLRDQRQEEDADRSESESRWVQQSEELTTRRADLEDRQQAFHEERRRWETERDEAQQQLGRRAEELDARQAELEAQIEASQQQEQGGDADRSESESRWVQQAEELTTRRADLEDRQQAFHEERRRWETERDEAQQRLGRRAEELEDRKSVV